MSAWWAVWSSLEPSGSQWVLDSVALGGVEEETPTDRGPAGVRPVRSLDEAQTSALFRAMQQELRQGGELSLWGCGQPYLHGSALCLVPKRPQWPEVCSKESQLRGVMYPVPGLLPGGPDAADPRPAVTGLYHCGIHFRGAGEGLSHLWPGSP